MRRVFSAGCALLLLGASACTSRSAPQASAPRDSGALPGSTFALEGVATWRGNANAAYSIIHDDICDEGADGALSIGSAQLKKRGLHAGFGVIVSKCAESARRPDQWPLVKALVAEGHDVFSHSWSHPCIDGDKQKPPEECPPDANYSSDMATEIGKAGEELKNQLGIAPNFFIFPYDYCNPRAVAFLKENGYLGARCGVTPEDVPTNGPGFADPFFTMYDVFGPAYSYYWNDGACKGKISQFQTRPYPVTADADTPPAPAECVSHVLQQYVDDTIRAKGWGVRELHGFHPVDEAVGTFEPISEADYAAHLDYIRAQQDRGALWVEGPTPILRYRFARTACAAPTLVHGNALHFGEVSAECRKYATTLSYLVSSGNRRRGSALHVLQGGKSLPARELGPGQYVVDADPTAGDALLIR